MADIKLFSISGAVEELSAASYHLERELQTLIENNMTTFFGVSFLRSEYRTTNGRIDSLGIDENYCPVIFEYKRSSNENVVTQGLFYLDWLLDHKADFKLLVIDVLGTETAEKLDWSFPRLICVASNFNKYDEYAVKQINRNIDLVRYKRFGDDLLLFELTNSHTADPVVDDTTEETAAKSAKKSGSNDKTVEEQLESTTQELRDIFQAIRDYILSLGDDVTEKPLKLYRAFKKIKNIACVEVYQKQILIHTRLNPDDIEMEDGFTRDMRNTGHFGTGDLQITIKNTNDFEKAKPILEMAYELN